MQNKIFIDRYDAGRKLSEQLLPLKKLKPVVLGLARGGVPVAYEIAKRLNTELDVIVARKIGSPYDPEYGIGAIAERGAFILDQTAIDKYAITTHEIHEEIEQEVKELDRRVDVYRLGEPLQNFHGRTVILVDDGMATGVTARAAILAIEEDMPEKIIFATPVCALESAVLVENQVSELICHTKSKNLKSISDYYKNFDSVNDSEVLDCLSDFYIYPAFV